jgi:hypothetical protein
MKPSQDLFGKSSSIRLGLLPVTGFSFRSSDFSASTARKMTKPMPIGNNQSLTGIGAEWNQKFKKGT